MHLAKIFNFSNQAMFFNEEYKNITSVKPLPFDWKRVDMDSVDSTAEMIAKSLPNNKTLFWDTKVSRKKSKMELKIITYH